MKMIFLIAAAAMIIIGLYLLLTDDEEMNRCQMNHSYDTCYSSLHH